MRKSKVPKSNSANLEQAYRSLISASRGLSRTLSPSHPESQPPPPQLESQSPSTVVSSFPAPVTPSPPSQEEIQTRSRNREEIRRVHDCYKRLKSSIGQRDGGGCSANLEQLESQSQDEGTYNKKKTKQDEASLKSEEDLELKQNLELYVERVQDPNPELQKAALESMRELDYVYSDYQEIEMESPESFSTMFMKPIHQPMCKILHLHK
ncbi:predicted protein [Arabidopsis lyrata subsp. lyrata]|uniref:Predicted protein n=1 Tax=Arabidopsis lyrata subsp. lyrata TaxID=81972 RepID=D7LNW1_ARALL|nr:predicted protein [Arabidopsis lyrata subsp. lyrata]